MKSSWLRNILSLLIVAGLAAGAFGCGEEPKKEEKKDEKKKGAAAAAAAGKKDKIFVPVAKPEWDAVSPHFLAYLDGLRSDLTGPLAGGNIHDVFLDHSPKVVDDGGAKGRITKLGVKPEDHDGGKKKQAKEKAQKDIDSILNAINAPAAKQNATPSGKGQLTAPTDPLTAFPLNRYTVRIVMTGVANPEAFVEAPDGKMHVLHRGDRLGAEGGLVVDLLKAKVLFRLPDREDLVEIAMAPEVTPTLLEGASMGAADKKTP